MVRIIAVESCSRNANELNLLFVDYHRSLDDSGTTAALTKIIITMDNRNTDQEYKVCHMCWMDKPLSEFLNRFQTRYCKICRTCRSGQLLRYYGVNKCEIVISREEEVYNQG